MTYSTGNLILRDDYNIFATGTATGIADHLTSNINSIIGTGYGDKGYGQPSTVTPVSQHIGVTATQWSTLISKLAPIAAHQGSAIVPVSQPTAGNTISAFAQISSNITLLNFNRYNKVANSASPIVSVATVSYLWKVQQVITHTVNFESADKARYFFNAGGEIRLDFSFTGNTATAKHTSWTDLLASAGTVIFSAQGTSYVGVTGSSAIANTTVGYFNLLTTNQILYKKYSNVPLYAANNIQVDVSSNGAKGANGDKGTIVTFTITISDDRVDFDNTDNIDGVLTANLTAYPPSTTYLVNSWGTPVVAHSITGDSITPYQNVIDVVGSAVTENSVTISFTNNNAGIPALILVKLGAYLVQSVETLSSPVTITNLQPNSLYTFSVYVPGQIGSAMTISEITLIAGITTVTSTTLSNSSVRIDFVNPNPNVSIVTVDMTQNGVHIQTFNNATSPTVISGLAANQHYTTEVFVQGQTSSHTVVPSVTLP
jgi:hypothetical protein